MTTPREMINQAVNCLAHRAGTILDDQAGSRFDAPHNAIGPGPGQTAGRREGNAPPLDIHASSVSASPRSLVGREGDKPTKSAILAARGGAKRRRHALRRTAGRALGKSSRVAKCGQQAIGGFVSLHHSDGHAHYGAVETCGSVWNCPVCSAKISEGRKQEIDAVLKAHGAAGGMAFMATLTIPHFRFDRCESLRKGVSAAWRKVKNGRPWQRARESHGWLGDIRALEITHGGNGWHPHLHVLILFKPGTPKNTAYSFGGWIFDAWASAVSRLGMGQCSENAYTYTVASTEDGAGEYIAKWGASLELTKAQIKCARSGGRTPWQILGDLSGTRKPADFALFREYAKAFKGARQLTWSVGLREHYAVEPEQADEALSEEPGTAETHTATLTRPLFKLIVAKGVTAHVLTAQETAGVGGVLRVLTVFGIPWHLSQVPGFERGRMVPLISLGCSQGQAPPCPLPGRGQNRQTDKRRM